jgi:hypothetical protein
MGNRAARLSYGRTDIRPHPHPPAFLEERCFTPHECSCVAEPRFNAGAAGDGELIGRS